MRTETFRSLREPNYRRYFTGHTCSVIGTWMQRIGQDWLVLELTGSGVALGGLLFFQFVPVLVGGAWGGVIVDRVDNRRLILLTQAAQAVLAAALAVFAATGTATLAVVYGLALALGVVTIFDQPARQAFVAELVEPDDIVNANSLNSLVNNIGRLVGPAVAGLLIAGVGVAVTFAVNALSFVAVLVSLWAMDVGRLRTPPRTGKAPGQVREGLRYVWRHRELRLTLVLVAVVSVFGQNFRVTLPLLATESFGGGASAYGWLMAVLGLGAVVGALFVAASSTTTSWQLLWACAAFGVVNLLVASSPTLAVAMAAVLALGIANITVNTLARTLLQLGSDASTRGRVMALHGLVFLGGNPVGGPLVGLVCEVWGPRAGMLVAGAACLAIAAVLFPAVRRSRHRERGDSIKYLDTEHP